MSFSGIRAPELKVNGTFLLPVQPLMGKSYQSAVRVTLRWPRIAYTRALQIRKGINRACFILRFGTPSIAVVIPQRSSPLPPCPPPMCGPSSNNLRTYIPMHDAHYFFVSTHVHVVGAASVHGANVIHLYPTLFVEILKPCSRESFLRLGKPT